MTQNPHYETLDPLDREGWESMRNLAHAMVDDSIDYLASVEQRPVWQRVPEAVAANFTSEVPRDPSDPHAVYKEFTEQVLPYNLGSIHPRFWGWYMGNGTVLGALADMLAATMNPNLGGGHNAPILVEQQVIRWMREIIGFPEGSSGLLVSGGSMANIVGLTVARNAMAGYDVRREGVQSGHPKLTLYGSEEVHSCNQKGAEMLGIGDDNFRRIPVRENFTMNLDVLVRRIDDDLKNGFRPVCVIASSGTVNTGAIDDLHAVADICEKYKIWFHVDGAIGGIAMLSSEVRPLLSGIERADSLALDLHKWMHVPFEAACVLVKDSAAHKDAFSLMPAYLQQGSGGMAHGGHWFSEYGLQLSRSFRALKIWMTLKEHGTEKLGRMISRNVDQAKYLGGLVQQEPDLELVAPIGLDIICFRYRPENVTDERLNQINQEILVELQESGVAAPTSTNLKGRFCIRVAIASHRCRYEDFDLLVNEVMTIGRRIIRARK